MSDADDLKTKTLERVASGIPGLDTILGGGFLRGGVYLVHAKPGSGKTILGNQICFRHVAGGGRALVVTLLTESHSRLLSQLENLTFFDAACVGSTLSYVSGYQALESDKLKGLLLLLRRTVRDHKATLLVIDGVVTAGAMAESELETKKFIHELQVFVELVGCTTLLLTGATAPAEQYAFRTMVDGLLELELDAVGMEAARTIEIAKFRGGAVLMGRHLFEITNAGITVYPRTESRARPVVGRPDPGLLPPAAFGIQGLDGMLAGGLRPGSITMALGTPGSGKTLLGLSMLAAGAKLWEPGLYFGFSETAVDLAQKAQGMGIPLAAHVDSGLVDIMCQSPLDSIADALAERLLEAVRARKVRRLFIDGLHGFKTSLVYPARAERFFTALCDELRSLGVVTLISDEMLSLGAAELPRDGLTTSLDNVILLRHVETQARIHKFVSVMKMRAGAGDSAVREFSIDARGFSVTSDEIAATGLLSEVIRESPPLEASRQDEQDEQDEQNETESQSATAIVTMKTILVVDDEYALAEILAELLQSEGYRVVSATNGKDGLARLKTENPDLILTDLMMPIVDGRELVRSARALPQFASTPVILMSASTKAVAMADASLGIAAFVRKPFQWEDLLATIVRLIGEGDRSRPEP